MPIISPIGRKSLQTRLLVGAIYAVLLAGAVTMVYPFLLMIAGTTKSAVDTPSSDVIPPFLVNDQTLYTKHMEGFFNESIESFRSTYDQDLIAFHRAEPPAHGNPAMADAWRDFLNSTPLAPHWYTISYVSANYSRGVFPSHLREFKRELMSRCNDSVERMNREMETEFVGWNSFFMQPEDYLQRRNRPGATLFHEAFRQFKQRQPLEERYYFSAEGFFKNDFLKIQYTKDLQAYNQAHGTRYAGWVEIHLDRRAPSAPGRTGAERADWELFVRTIVNLLWLRTDSAATPSYREFLRAKYKYIQVVNRNYGTRYSAFGEMPFSTAAPAEGLALSDWDAFLQGWTDPDTKKVYLLPLECIEIDSVDFRFRDYLERRFKTVADANAALGTKARDWIDFQPPQRDFHCRAFEKQKGKLRWEFMTRNYVTVIDYLAFHGHAIQNTVIYCALAILTALIVNPLAAYALSRFKPPSTYKLLLFLLLTMAFPPMVTQIPMFLMMRDFNLLNSFAALVLPGLANGYSIFLLKGFFDSLPKELYESASMDGASEARIFWDITMSLSKPILAVIALGAFTGAYGNFMFALLICQDERMWTLMPWLYQLQLRSGQGVVFASLVLAAIPTFGVFALCQNVIMRGIVVPSEK